MPRCPWTGILFSPATRGGLEKVFVNDRARAQAHKAARQYTLAQIRMGMLSWEELRTWYDDRNAISLPYTAREPSGAS